MRLNILLSFLMNLIRMRSVRWASMLTIADGQLFPALSLKLAAEAMDRDIVVFFNEIGVEAISLINREDESDSVEIPVDFYGRGKI